MAEQEGLLACQLDSYIRALHTTVTRCSWPSCRQTSLQLWLALYQVPQHPHQRQTLQAGCMLLTAPSTQPSKETDNPMLPAQLRARGRGRRAVGCSVGSDAAVSRGRGPAGGPRLALRRRRSGGRAGRGGAARHTDCKPVTASTGGHELSTLTAWLANTRSRPVFCARAMFGRKCSCRCMMCSLRARISVPNVSLCRGVPRFWTSSGCQMAASCTTWPPRPRRRRGCR